MASLTGPPGPYAIQAAIAAEHARAETADATDWRRISDLYGRLRQVQPTPVVELNRAVAVAMAEGPEAGLAIVDGIEGLDGYQPFHSTGPTCCAASIERPRPATPTGARSSSPRTRSSGRSSSAGSPNWPDPGAQAGASGSSAGVRRPIRAQSAYGPTRNRQAGRQPDHVRALQARQGRDRPGFSSRVRDLLGELSESHDERAPAKQGAAVVLVADGDADIAELLRLILEDEGHQVIRANDGEQAMMLALQHRPDLCVLDLELPQFDGPSATRLLRAADQTKATPVIMMSTGVREERIAAGQEAGADAHLVKPFVPDDFLARCAACSAGP